QAVLRGEVAADPCRLDAHRAKIAFENSCSRLTFDTGEQRADPGWRLAAFERPAAKARSVPGNKRVFRPREKLDIFRFRLARVARRPAEDPRRADAQVEHAVVGRIGCLISVLHFRPSRQRGEGEGSGDW